MKKLIIILGVVGTSLSAVLVRFADAPSTVLVFYRMLFSVLLLAPVVLTRCKGEYRSMEKKHLFLCMASGLFLGIHFACYFEALNRTSIAACVSLVDTEVFFVALGGTLFLREKLSGKGWLYIVLTFVGSVVIAAADVSGGDITLKHSYAFTGEVISLVCRCVLTIAAELVIGWLFLFRGKELFRLICVTNAVTQILLNLALNITNYLFGSMGYVMFYVLLEAAVFVIEGIVYSAYLKRHPQEKQLRPWGYALVSNGLSFALGLWLSHVIPGIF